MGRGTCPRPLKKSIRIFRKGSFYVQNKVKYPRIWYNGIVKKPLQIGGISMLKEKDMQLSIYSILYNKVPKNHTLKILRDEVDFSFINKKIEKAYCKRYGRPDKEPELMVKLLVLQNLYNLSDVRVIEEASLNLAYMYFLGINPEDELPHPSLLTKFRKDKLEGNLTMDEIMAETIQQCVEKDILEGSGISIDTTHTEANTFKCIAERVMKRLASK